MAESEEYQAEVGGGRMGGRQHQGQWECSLGGRRSRGAAQVSSITVNGNGGVSGGGGGVSGHTSVTYDRVE